MKLNWYLSLILAGILYPTLAFSQNPSDQQGSAFKTNLNFENNANKNTLFLSNSITQEQNNSAFGLNPSSNKEDNPIPKKVETPPTDTPKLEETETTPATQSNSCETAPPNVKHPLAPPTEIAESETEATENNADLLSLEKPEKSEVEDHQEVEKKEDKFTISQAEINNYPTLAKADYFYRCGDTLLAERFYRDVKEPFGNEQELNRELLAQAVYDPEYLLPGGSVYWRLYQESLTESEVYESKRIAPLKLLSQDYPEFIPGHIKYSEILKEDDRHEEAQKVLKNAVNLYPNEAPLVKAKIEADEQAENWLAASLTARQFAVFNQEHFFRVVF